MDGLPLSNLFTVVAECHCLRLYHMSSQWCSKIRLLLRVRVNRFLEIFHLFLSLGLRKKRQYWQNNAIKRHTIKKIRFFCENCNSLVISSRT